MIFTHIKISDPLIVCVADNFISGHETGACDRGDGSANPRSDDCGERSSACGAQ